jgi:hypothetical protein
MPFFRIPAGRRGPPIDKANSSPRTADTRWQHWAALAWDGEGGFAHGVRNDRDGRTCGLKCSQCQQLSIASLKQEGDRPAGVVDVDGGLTGRPGLLGWQLFGDLLNEDQPG